MKKLIEGNPALVEEHPDMLTKGAIVYYKDTHAPKVEIVLSQKPEWMLNGLFGENDDYDLSWKWIERALEEAYDRGFYPKNLPTPFKLVPEIRQFISLNSLYEETRKSGQEVRISLTRATKDKVAKIVEKDGTTKIIRDPGWCIEIIPQATNAFAINEIGDINQMFYLDLKTGKPYRAPTESSYPFIPKQRNYTFFATFPMFANTLAVALGNAEQAFFYLFVGESKDPISFKESFPIRSFKDAQDRLAKEITGKGLAVEGGALEQLAKDMMGGYDTEIGQPLWVIESMSLGREQDYPDWDPSVSKENKELAIVTPDSLFKDLDEHQVKLFMQKFNLVMSDNSKRSTVLENSDFGHLWKFTCRSDHSKSTELKIRQELLKAGWRVVFFERVVPFEEVFTIYKVGIA